jgi:hypothetical protein
VHEEVFLVLTTDGIIAIPRSGDSIAPNIEPWRCNYTQIESVGAVPSQMQGFFGIKLCFYNRDADATKIVIINFDCKETEIQDGHQEERKAGEVISTQARKN